MGSSIRKEHPLHLRDIASQITAHKNIALLESNRNLLSPRYINKLVFLEEDITDLKNNIHKKYDPFERLKPLKAWFRQNAILKSELEGPILLNLEPLSLSQFKELSL